MFSVMVTMMTPGLALNAESLRLVHAEDASLSPSGRVLTVGLQAVDTLLPEGGIPRGGVVELAATRSLGQCTSLALRLCAAAQDQARQRGGEPAWCAWLDPSCSLHAPGVAAYGVSLDRLLVVRPSLPELARIAVRVVSSRVFSVVVIDAAGVPGATVATPLNRWANVVRRLSMAAKEGDTCVVLVTDKEASRAASLPVMLRLELEQRSPDSLTVSVTKERRGRIGPVRDLAYVRAPRLPGLPGHLRSA